MDGYWFNGYRFSLAYLTYMAYLQLPNFKYGLDTRRGELTSQPGTLQTLNNAHINQGGEIEKRLAFVSLGALPSGSFGFEVATVGTLVFGSIVDPTGWPTGTTYQRLQHPAVTLGATFDGTKHAMTAVLCSTSFGSNAWVAATFADGKTFAFYNGAYIAAWTNGVVLSAWTTQAQVAGVLRAQVASVTGFNVGVVTSGGSFQFFDMWANAGLDFSISPAPLSGGVTSAAGTLTATKISDGTDGVPAVAATSSFQIIAGTTGTITSVQISTNGSVWTEILGAAVTYITDNTTTAQAIATQINNFISGVAYSAQANLGQVTVVADPSLGATPNGYFLRVTTTGDVCCDNIAFGFVGQVATNTCTSVKFNTTGATLLELLSGTVTFAASTTIPIFVAAIAANIRANVAVNATYTACAIANVLYISRKVATSFVPIGTTGSTTTVSAGSITDNHSGTPVVLMALSLAPSPAVVVVSPFGGGGTITVTATIAGGVAPYTYHWAGGFNSNITIQGSTTSQSALFKLSSGTASASFACTVIDSGGIQITKNVTVSFQNNA